MIDKQKLTVAIAKGATSGTTLDPCNPLRGELREVWVKSSDDVNVNGMKVELLKDDDWFKFNDAKTIKNRESTGASFSNATAIYTGNDAAMPDDNVWHRADDEDLDVRLSFARDGYYKWKITVDVATQAAMTVYLQRVIET